MSFGIQFSTEKTNRKQQQKVGRKQKTKTIREIFFETFFSLKTALDRKITRLWCSKKPR